jgi:hypothetical protein
VSTIRPELITATAATVICVHYCYNYSTPRKLPKGTLFFTTASRVEALIKCSTPGPVYMQIAVPDSKAYNTIGTITVTKPKAGGSTAVAQVGPVKPLPAWKPCR